jgi:hypothetical protein
MLANPLTSGPHPKAPTAQPSNHGQAVAAAPAAHRGARQLPAMVAHAKDPLVPRTLIPTNRPRDAAPSYCHPHRHPHREQKESPPRPDPPSTSRPRARHISARQEPRPHSANVQGRDFAVQAKLPTGGTARKRDAPGRHYEIWAAARVVSGSVSRRRSSPVRVRWCQCSAMMATMAITAMTTTAPITLPRLPDLDSRPAGVGALGVPPSTKARNICVLAAGSRSLLLDTPPPYDSPPRRGHRLVHRERRVPACSRAVIPSPASSVGSAAKTRDEPTLSTTRPNPRQI